MDAHSSATIGEVRRIGILSKILELQFHKKKVMLMVGLWVHKGTPQEPNLLQNRHRLWLPDICTSLPLQQQRQTHSSQYGLACKKMTLLQHVMHQLTEFLLVMFIIVVNVVWRDYEYFSQLASIE